MVLAFSAIPLHLQSQITAKLEICDFVQLKGSSEHGRSVADLVKTKITMDVGTLNIELCDDEEVIYMRRDDNSDNLLWNSVKTHENCPRFCTQNMEYTSARTNEDLNRIIGLAEEGCFCGRKVKLGFEAPEILLDMELFNRFLEVFDVKEILHYDNYGPMDQKYFKIPAFRKLDVVKINHSYIGDDDLLALKAHTIICLSQSPNLRSTLTEFFKQWYSGNREIVVFQVGDQTWTAEDCTALFHGIPFTTLWCPETNGSRSFAALQLQHSSDISSSEESHFVLKRGADNLFVTISANHVSAKKVDNPIQYLFEQI